MCAVSSTYDYFRQNVPVEQWTIPAWKQFQDIIERLDKLDETLNQKDCFDPEKAKWTNEVEERLKKLENKNGV